MPHDDGQNDNRIFAALAFMDAHRVGGLKLAHLLPLIFRRMVFAVAHDEPLFPDGFDETHVAVENIFLVIVPYLHDLIPDAEGKTARRNFRLVSRGWIQRRLQETVQPVDAAGQSVHRGQDLHVPQRIDAEGGKLVATQGDDGLRRFQRLSQLGEQLLALFEKPEGNSRTNPDGGKWMTLKEISARLKDAFRSAYVEDSGCYIRIGNFLSRPEERFESERRAAGMVYWVRER